jgi:hypothetical protein
MAPMPNRPTATPSPGDLLKEKDSKPFPGFFRPQISMLSPKNTSRVILKDQIVQPRRSLRPPRLQAPRKPIQHDRGQLLGMTTATPAHSQTTLLRRLHGRPMALASPCWSRDCRRTRSRSS